MAIDEPDPTPKPQAYHSSPLMQFESSALFAMILQIAAGAITILMFGPALIILLPLFSLMPEGPVNPVGFYSLLLLIPISIVQLYMGYRLFKKIPNTVTISVISDLLAFALYVASLVSSIMTDTLASSPQIYIGVIGINLCAAILLLLPSSRDTFEGQKWTSPY
ncbi:MAG: hypothetical protein ACFFE2_12110 [Candidatus Thorarchaeota archaeon]